LRISDWVSDGCASDLLAREAQGRLAADRARQEAQERQQVRERERVAEKFNTIAGKREAGAHGYGDHNSDWKATPEALRKAVDAHNGANQHTKDLYIEQIQREPQMARAVGQLIGERELIMQRDRGMSLCRRYTIRSYMIRSPMIGSYSQEKNTPPSWRVSPLPTIYNG